jgi:hypothetical protein
VVVILAEGFQVLLDSIEPRQRLAQQVDDRG